MSHPDVKNRATNSKGLACECGLPNPEQCCRAIHAGLKSADSAEQLMRSRYVAYVLGLEAYLLDTWHVSTRPASLGVGAPSTTRWLGLEVKRHLPDGDRAVVEFVARYREGGGAAVRMQERSRFVREQGQWFYVDGDVS